MHKDYKYLTERGDYSIDEICSRFENTLKEANRVVEKLGIEDKVRIDIRILEYVICDYFADIARLKDFHEIEHTNVAKVYSYLSYWFARKKPIQILETVDDSLLYINEIIAMNLALPKMCRELGIGIEKIRTVSSINDFLDLFKYNLIYRTFTPQTIELTLQAIISSNKVYRV